jgi:hypothetical protein
MHRKRSHHVVKALLVRIDDYCLRAKIPASKFGYITMHDASFVEQLRQGRLPRLNTVDRLNRWLDVRTKAVRTKFSSPENPTAGAPQTLARSPQRRQLR